MYIARCSPNVFILVDPLAETDVPIAIEVTNKWKKYQYTSIKVVLVCLVCCAIGLTAKLCSHCFIYLLKCHSLCVIFLTRMSY